jgi:methyltransferase (TIGR00027 family)
VAHERSGAAVEDPLARKLLLGAGGAAGNELLHTGANVEYMSLRKTLGDELVHESYVSHAVRQVVSIGAGLDSRAFRLGLSGVSFFEVDSQELFDMKEPLVADLPLGAPGCTRRIVPGFLGAPGFELTRGLREAGHDSSKPTVWLMEGLLPYLTRTQVSSLATDLGSLSAPGSALWGDSFSYTSVARGMIFHDVPFAEGLDDYDEVFGKLGGFQRSEAFDMGGVELDMGAHTRGGRVGVRIHPSARISKETVRGRGMCVMVRAFKTA